MIVPHAHQVTMLDEARASIRQHDAVILQSPTGSGKTVLGTLIAQGAVANGRRVMFTVHRDFLVDQTVATFRDAGLDCGIVAAGFTPNARAPAQVCSIDTLKHRLAKVAAPDLLIVDECHHSVAAGWAKVIDHFKGAGTKVIGLSATPVRLDGRGLGEHYSAMVKGPTVRWLIDNGFLCDYAAYAPSTPDLSGVHSKMGDYVRSEAAEVVDRPSITGDAVREYSRLAGGRRAVAFCISVAHSEHVCAQFNASGIPAAHIDGTTPRDQRKAILERFRRGEVLVLTSVEIFGEGFDLPAVEVAILLRPTQSLSLHLQQIGRALRTSPGKERAIILDHCGNLMRPGLGLPDSEFDWSLDGRKKRKKADGGEPVFVKQCAVCYGVFWPPPRCPHCGHVHEVEAREIEQVDGELTEITPEMMAALKLEKRVQVGRAKTLEALEEIERERGYQRGWAAQVFKSRESGSSRRMEAQFAAYAGGR